MDSRNISLDLLKVVLAICIVFLHCGFFIEYNELIHFLTVHGIFRIAVPIFFIINGYFFDAIIKTKKINKWSIKVLILYTVWMIIYLPSWFSPDIKTIFVKLITGYHHLWYIKAMLFCGILLYILRNLKTKILLALVSVLFSIGILFQYLGNYHVFESSSLDAILNLKYTYRNFLFLGFPFFVIGYCCKKDDWKEKIQKQYLIILFPIALTLLLLESYFNYVYTREVIENLFFLILVCPLVFIYFLKSEIKFKTNTKNIALVSTSIYLIHPWIMEILTNLFEVRDTQLGFLTVVVALSVSLPLIKLNKILKFLL